MPYGTTLVYLDSAEENLSPELGLPTAKVLDGDWNGWLRPVATAAAFGAFLDAWRANDPNGTWGYATEVGNSLVYVDSVSDYPESFPRVSEETGSPALYDLSGWVWVRGPVD